MPDEDRYIWHETLETEDTRRSFLSEVDPAVLRTVQGWLQWDRFDLPGGYRCVITSREQHCLRAEVHAGQVRLVVIGVAAALECGQPLWESLGGLPGARPQEPWCVASLDPLGLATRREAYRWLGDFERVLAWAWLEGKFLVDTGTP